MRGEQYAQHRYDWVKKAMRFSFDDGDPALKAHPDLMRPAETPSRPPGTRGIEKRSVVVLVDSMAEQPFGSADQPLHLMVAELLVAEDGIVEGRLDFGDQGVALARERRDECEPGAIAGVAALDRRRGLLESPEAELTHRRVDLLEDGGESLVPLMVATEHRASSLPVELLDEDAAVVDIVVGHAEQREHGGADIGVIREDPAFDARMTDAGADHAEEVVDDLFLDVAVVPGEATVLEHTGGQTAIDRSQG